MPFQMHQIEEFISQHLAQLAAAEEARQQRLFHSSAGRLLRGGYGSVRPAAERSRLVAGESRRGPGRTVGAAELARRGQDCRRAGGGSMVSGAEGSAGADPRQQVSNAIRTSHHPSPLPSQRCGSLKTILKMLPSPPRGSYSNMARLSWHNSRAMNNPSPVPPLRPVKNGSKMRSTACGSMPGPAIRDFEKGPIAGVQSAELDLDADAVARFAVLDGVVAEIPNHLMQVAGIDAHFQIARLLDEGRSALSAPAWFRRIRPENPRSSRRETGAWAWSPRGATAATHC